MEFSRATLSTDVAVDALIKTAPIKVSMRRILLLQSERGSDSGGKDHLIANFRKEGGGGGVGMKGNVHDAWACEVLTSRA